MPHLTRNEKAATASIFESRKRKEAALAGLRELQLKERRGELVDAEQIAAETEARFRADAEALLNWPASIAPEFAAELGIDERRAYELLNRGIHKFMRERSMVGIEPAAAAPKPKKQAVRKPAAKRPTPTPRRNRARRG